MGTCIVRCQMLFFWMKTIVRDLLFVSQEVLLIKHLKMYGMLLINLLVLRDCIVIYYVSLLTQD